MINIEFILKTRKFLLKVWRQTFIYNDASSWYKWYYTNLSPVLFSSIPIWSLKWDIYKEIFFRVEKKNKAKLTNSGARYSCNNQHKKKKSSHYIFERGMDVVGKFFFNPNIYGETCTTKWLVFRMFYYVY